jgi:predicted 2-oxoglutarate/Fe(II)-dependent dioxygenase YbiX
MNIWNPAPDVELNDIVIEANKVRNIIEGRPRYFATRLFDELVLQYRLSCTVSKGLVVKPHTDLFDEFRSDPAGSHRFNPKRCQMTLFLSNYDEDYCDGGFYFHDNSDRELLFGKDVKVEAGDLLIWKYSNKHCVRNVNALNTTRGFSRVIFPQFDNMNNKGD